MDAKTTSRRTLGIVFLSLLIDLLGFTVILPLLPAILEYYSTKEQVKHQTRASRERLRAPFLVPLFRMVFWAVSCRAWTSSVYWLAGPEARDSTLCCWGVGHWGR